MKKRVVLWMDWFRDERTFLVAGMKHCCSEMTSALEIECDEHSGDGFACSDVVLSFSPMFREYGIQLDGNSSLTIDFCPWCGKKLPHSLRNLWFERMDAFGLDNPFDEDRERVPEAYKSAEWWQKEN